LRGEGNCSSSLDLVQTESTRTLFFATQLAETEPHEVHRHFLPYADAFAVGVEFGLTEPDTSFFSNKVSWRDGSHISSSTNVQTVMMKDDAPWKVIQPDGKPLVLTLNDVMEMVSVESVISDPWHQAFNNGMEIDFDVRCFSKNHPSHMANSNKHHTCHMSAHLVRKEQVFRWVGSIFSNPQKYYGLRLNFHTDGSWERPYWGAFVDGIVDLLVLLTLPRKAVVFFATHCLGHLSKIYFHAINQHFGIRQHMGGLAARIMTSSVAYVNLRDSQNTAGEGGISHRRMLERLTASLHDCLGTPELEQLAHFCFGSVHQYAEEKGKPSLFDKVRHSKAPHDDTQLITEHQFDLAALSNEAIDLKDIAPLFSSTRKLGLCKRFFTPQYLQSLKKRASTDKKALQKTDTMDRGLDILGQADFNFSQQYGNSLEEKQDMNAQTLTDVRDLNRKSVKTDQMLDEVAAGLEASYNVAQKLHGETHELTRCYKNVTTVLESVSRSIENINQRISNEVKVELMQMRKAICTCDGQLVADNVDKTMTGSGPRLVSEPVQNVENTTSNQLPLCSNSFQAAGRHRVCHSQDAVMDLDVLCNSSQADGRHQVCRGDEAVMNVDEFFDNLMLKLQHRRKV